MRDFWRPWRIRDTKCVMFGEVVGGVGCVGDLEKEWIECFLDDFIAFGIDADQWTIAAQEEGMFELLSRTVTCTRKLISL